jgi:two-component system chemotaxis sensor kinase CheA
MSEGMDEIIEDFVTEAEEALEKVDPLFVEIEDKGYDKDLLNEIFRSIHTIKGAAGFLGFQTIVDVSHKTESLLKKLRDGEIEVSSPLISLVLKSVDSVKALLGGIKSKSEGGVDTDPILVDLDAALAGEMPVAEEAVKAAREAEKLKEQAAQRPAEEPASAQTEETPEVVVAKAKAEPAAAESAFPEKRQEKIKEDASREARKEAQEEAAPEEGADMSPEASSPLDGALAGLEEAVPSAPTAQVEEKMQGPAAPQAQQQQGQQGREFMQTLRVDVDRIDKVMNLTGEIVLVRNRLLNIGNFLEGKYPSDEHVEGLQETVAFLDLVTSDIQLAVMKMRMQPIKKVFGKFPRLVRDISQNLGKDVQLNISGEDTEVDRSVIERIGDPMVHIIRNAIDHGIESINERRKLGKPIKGTVNVSAYQQGSQIIIEVSDDGKGLDVERVRQRAIERGLITEEDAQRMTDKEITNIIFLPGFSTLDVATELSGRGVGMDVVKTNISKLNGYVEVMSNPDEGTTFRISIPLTLAIIQALMVRAGGIQYAIPLSPIEETIKISIDDIDNITGNKVVTIRERVHPIVELTDILNLRPTEEEPEYRYVLVIAIGDRRFCLSVDELLGQEEVVIKAIEGIDTDATGILGATITGEGKIVLILDPASISKLLIGIGTA